MLRPVHTAPDSPVTSPENARHHKSGVQSSTNTLNKKSSLMQSDRSGSVPRRLEKSNSSGGGCMSEPEFFIDNSAPSHHSR